MKLRNKKTREIGKIAKTKTDDDEIEIVTDTKVYVYKSISEVCQHWEDYEGPKEYWFMNYGGRIKAINDANNEEDVAAKEIGNYFETKEEAEKAVEKLKAWKRLKDKGFRFVGYNNCFIDYDIDEKYRRCISGDLDLLFGGEE